MWYAYELLTLGENKHATVTLADKLIVTDIDVSRSGTYSKMNAHKTKQEKQKYCIKTINNKMTTQTFKYAFN